MPKSYLAAAAAGEAGQTRVFTKDFRDGVRKEIPRIHLTNCLPMVIKATTGCLAGDGWLAGWLGG